MATSSEFLRITEVPSVETINTPSPIHLSSRFCKEKREKEEREGERKKERKEGSSGGAGSSIEIVESC